VDECSQQNSLNEEIKMICILVTYGPYKFSISYTIQKVLKPLPCNHNRIKPPTSPIPKYVGIHDKTVLQWKDNNHTNSTVNCAHTTPHEFSKYPNHHKKIKQTLDI
jgi:hypothetical protein